MDSFDKKKSKAVADQDLQIKGGEGGPVIQTLR